MMRLGGGLGGGLGGFGLGGGGDGAGDGGGLEGGGGFLKGGLGGGGLGGGVAVSARPPVCSFRLVWRPTPEPAVDAPSQKAGAKQERSSSAVRRSTGGLRAPRDAMGRGSGSLQPPEEHSTT